MKVASPIGYVKCPDCGGVTVLDVDQPAGMYADKGVVKTRGVRINGHPHRAFVPCAHCGKMIETKYRANRNDIVDTFNTHFPKDEAAIERAKRRRLVMDGAEAEPDDTPEGMQL